MNYEESTAYKEQDTSAAAAAATEAPPAVAHRAAKDDIADEQDAESGCPICQFIEAGACGQEHKGWVECRHDAKRNGVDFVQHCSEQFRIFFGCMLDHQDYYQPFLEAFHVDVDKSQTAIDKAKERDQQQGQPDKILEAQQQQQQQGQAPESPKQAAAPLAQQS